VEAWIAGTGLHDLEDPAARYRSVTAEDVRRWRRSTWSPPAARRAWCAAPGRPRAGAADLARGGEPPRDHLETPETSPARGPQYPRSRSPPPARSAARYDRRGRASPPRCPGARPAPAGPQRNIPPRRPRPPPSTRAHRRPTAGASSRR
jgi:hypothetical protein